jgi:hypothetical protein
MHCVRGKGKCVAMYVGTLPIQHFAKSFKLECYFSPYLIVDNFDMIEALSVLFVAHYFTLSFQCRFLAIGIFLTSKRIIFFVNGCVVHWIHVDQIGRIFAHWEIVGSLMKITVNTYLPKCFPH